MHHDALDWEALGGEALDLFRQLLRLDTTNPPGQEHLACELLAESLRADGIEPWVAESAPGRANLVARLPATTPEPEAGPLLLAGHTDVVPAAPAQWTHPPFAGAEADEMIWGRGALDMKNMVAMSAMVLKLLARHPELERRREVIFAAVADEEEGCALGSSWLVEHHPERVRAEYMIGEVGGFWLNIGPRTYIPIMVAEKGRVHMRLRAHGPPGHGSIPHEDNALARMAQALTQLERRRLPYHLTPVVERFVRTLAATQPAPTNVGLLGMLRGQLEPLILDKLLPERGQARSFHAMLHNTATPTTIQGGGKLNVLPRTVDCELDGRTLPGQTAHDLAREVRQALDDSDIDVEILSASPPVVADPIEGPLLGTIERVVGRHAPEAVCVPYMITGFTDARAFSRLGTRCYGFSPLKLEPRHGLKFSELFHGVDERIPAEGFRWGQRVLFEVVAEFVSAGEGS